jgi:hypothetical protein
MKLWDWMLFGRGPMRFMLNGGYYSVDLNIRKGIGKRSLFINR